MRGAKLGTYSLVFAGFVLLMGGLHFLNVIPLLNTVLPFVISLFGGIMGVLGFFERDKKRIPALLGMVLNFAMLGTWVWLLVLTWTA